MMRCVFLILCLLTHASFAGTLTPLEQQIHDDISTQHDAQIALLDQLVNVNSGTTNPPGVHVVGEMVKPLLEQMGFTTTWVEEPASLRKAGTLVAERKGNQGKRLLLIGHLDTVFATDSPFQKFERRGNNAKGPGVLDDKGGLVVLLSALKALNDAHALNNTSITVVLTGDEEESGKPATISRKPLFEAGKHSDVALDFEPSITLETATIARRGISNWTVESHGNESHSATIFQKGVGAGAIFELARILNTMRSTLAGEKDITFNPGLVLAGTEIRYDKTKAAGNAFGKENVVAKIAMAKGDLRFLTLGQKQSLEAKMISIVKAHLPFTHSSIAFVDGIPPMQPTQNNLDLLKQYSEASQLLGLGEVKAMDAGLRGAGDISYVASIVPANLAGLGPIGIGTHSVIEAVELKSLQVQTQRAALLIYRLTR